MNLTWGNILPVWWSFVWRAALYGFALGFVFGFFGGFSAAVLGTPQNAAAFGTACGFIAGTPASMLALKQALTKHLRQLAMLANATPA